MRIEEMKPLTNKKSIVYWEDGSFFCLYTREIKKYHIESGMEIPDSFFQQIREKVVLLRGKKRALHLLNQTRKTEQALREKLRQDKYDSSLVEEIISYVKGFGYLDDELFAKDYVEWHKEKKSKKELFYGLCQKGIAPSLATEILEAEYEEEDGSFAVRKYLEEKKGRFNFRNPKEKEKVIRYFARKGFPYSVVKKELERQGEEMDFIE